MSDYLAFPREEDETIIENFFTILSNTNSEYESLLQRAIAIAAKAHDGQVDKAGNPYLFYNLSTATHGVALASSGYLSLDATKPASF